MPSYNLLITDTDEERSGVLGRMRLDGVGRVTVPFGERVVHAWQRGVPDPGMDMEIIIDTLSVRCMVRLGRPTTPAAVLTAQHREVSRAET